MTTTPTTKRKAPLRLRVLAAIDVGTNAVRLKVVRPHRDGTLELLHQERDPIRPGEGVFESGVMSRAVADRLLSTLRRYSALCRRHRATVRAVATSALREAKNKQSIVDRVRKEARLTLEIVSGKEEARLICLGVLQGMPKSRHSLCIDIGGGSTEVAVAQGEKPTQLYSVSMGAVRLAQVFEATDDVPTKKLRLMRDFAEEAMEETLPEVLSLRGTHALGSSGTVAAIVEFASGGGTTATRRQISRAVEVLRQMDGEKRHQLFDARRADIIVSGAVILEAVLDRFAINEIEAVDQGLRDGLLVDMLNRQRVAKVQDSSLVDAALALGKRFYMEEAHAKQVSRIAVSLFDDLSAVHKLPLSSRPYLEVAALLHDIGNAVSYQRHHKHTYYLINNADIPGLTDRERELIAQVARFHRRSLPEAGHEALAALLPQEVRMVRSLSTLLRVADSLDRSHHQPVKQVRALIRPGRVLLRVRATTAIDLEIWDLEHEMGLFKQVFGRELVIETGRKLA